MIEIKNLHKNFGSNKVLQGVDLDIDTGETIVIIGKSGCGKSVLLKHIVGLLKPNSGYVKVENQNVNEISIKELYTLRKKFGFLFQGAALFDSMTVEENISLSLVESDNGYSSAEIKKMVAEKLEMVGMPGTENYILYDEPTTGLDPIMSDSIDKLIKELDEKLNVTSIVVTHDMYSVKNVANKVAMMHDGIIHFVGSREELVKSNDQIIHDFIRRTET